MKRAAFLDRDGTINVDMGYLNDVKKLRLYSNSAKAIKLLIKKGFKIIVVTNQSGIGRGLVRKSELRNINRRLKEMLAKKGVKIDAFYICIHHPDENCKCRKPKTRLLKKAAKDFGLDLSRCYVVGDKLSDVELGRNAGLKEAILLRTGFGRRHIREAKKIGFKLGPVCRDIYSAAKLICKFESS
jgi:D-glycero-D-manno-heptose 1,7-bisphosphate phosphatase